ncbi:MAG: right-handed parallel beta-helix repeat-containing protein [Candidatus Krumholzibacteriia bacterium]
MKLSSVVAVALIAFMSSAGHARTWRVNAAGTGDAPSIAAALDSCAAGDSVLVAAGNYQIDSHLFIDEERVTFVSEAGAEATVLERAAAPVGLLISTDSVIEGFTLDSIFISGGGSFQQGGRISNNVFRGVGDPNDAAISFWLFSGVTISGNCIHSYGCGIGFQESSGFIVDNNTIAACGTALILDGSYPWNTIRNNLIVGNNYGINLSGGVVGEVSCNNVFGNSIANYIYGTDPTGTNGNISVDPEFCAADPPGSGNFLLQSDSPCAPGNHPDGYACGIIGAYPVGCQEVSVEKSSWGAIKAIYK